MPRYILALIDFSVILQITITSLGVISGINTWQTGRQLTLIKLRGRFDGCDRRQDGLSTSSDLQRTCIHFGSTGVVLFKVDSVVAAREH